MSAGQGLSLDVQAVLNAFPFFAMVLDDRHHVIASNTMFVREAECVTHTCPVSCYLVIHQADRPHPECPLVESARSHKPVERFLPAVMGYGAHVSVYPLRARSEQGRPLFLHLIRAEDASAEKPAHRRQRKARTSLD